MQRKFQLKKTSTSKKLVIKKPAIVELQGLVEEVKTKVPSRAHAELHVSLHRLQEKIAKRLANPEIPAHPKVNASANAVTIEIRKLRLAAKAIPKGEVEYVFRSRRWPPTSLKSKSPRGSKQGGSKSVFQANAVKLSVNRLNYYLALPGEGDEPDVQ